jgi:hypothetical protein
MRLIFRRDVGNRSATDKHRVTFQVHSYSNYFN